MQWNGDAFTISGTATGPVVGTCDIQASGRFSASDNTMSGNFKTSCKFKQGNVERESIVEFALDSLPPMMDLVPEQGREPLTYSR